MKDKPSLIICRTVIGFGSPNKAGKEEAHGAALGDEEVALTRQKLGWKYPPFEIPKEIYRAWDAREEGEKAQHARTRNLPPTKGLPGAGGRIHPPHERRATGGLGRENAGAD